jgi:hypothetical protein
MSNRQWDDSVHCKEEFEEETEPGIGREACKLVTISELEESEKAKVDSQSSTSETEMETEPLSWGFSFCGTVLSVKRMGDCYIVGRGDHFFKRYDRDRQ